MRIFLPALALVLLTGAIAEAGPFGRFGGCHGSGACSGPAACSSGVTVTVSCSGTASAGCHGSGLFRRRGRSSGCSTSVAVGCSTCSGSVVAPPAVPLRQMPAAEPVPPPKR